MVETEEIDPKTGKPKKNKGQSSSEELKLSDYDPLYLHSSDSNGNPLISFKLEGTENYKVWSAAIKLALHTKNKLGFITGKCERPTDDDILRQEQWDRCNSVVLSWILGCVTQELYLGQIYSTNAKKVWDELEETYSKSDGSVIFNMHYKIHSFTQSGMPLAEYYHKFNSQWRQYDSLVSLPECSCDTADKLKSHNQLIRLMQFLMGLDDVYASVRSNILITDPIPDVKSAFATLSRDESHGNSTMHNVKTSSTAFVARSNNDWSGNRNNQNRRFNQNRGPNTSLVCENCNMTGHTVDRCFELIGYPRGFEGIPKVNNPKSSVNNASTSNSSGNTHGNVAGIPANASFVICFASCRFFNFNTKISTYSAYVGWIIDSGASQHMTYTSMFLFNVIDVSHLNITVSHPNGTVEKVNQVGSFKLTEKLIIHDVLVVPGYHVSLLSVHKLASANKVSVVFNESDCLIQDSTLKSLMGTGSMIGGLYYLDQGKKFVNSNVRTCNVSKCLWHNRLGHPADQVLSVLKNKIDLSDMDSGGPCEVCHKAKQTREPFPLSDHKTTSLGQLVHLDVWGPYKVKSKEGYRYFLTIVDDYSRAVWVSMLKGKDEVFSNVVSFYNLIKNQFEKTVKIFRSDNGTEFVNKQFNNFCDINGIVHQTSCAYTPQQNGVAERKHRHLLNVARALMLPSAVLSGRSPYELVYKSEPILSHLRSFGCLCFASVLNNSDKFSSRSEKCVFLGYSLEKKGSNEPCDDVRDCQDKGDGTMPRSKDKPKSSDKSATTEESAHDKADSTSCKHVGADDFGIHPASTSEKFVMDNDISNNAENSNPLGSITADGNLDQDDATSNDENYESEGEDFDNFGQMFGSDEFDPESIVNEETVRRSSRRSKLPSRLEDYELGGKVKYGLDRHVNYSNLSSETYSFVTNLNKAIEPKSYKDASTDPRWVDAMNQEMEAFNRNNTWEICDLPKGRRPITCKWIYKIKYKSNGDVERYKARLVARGCSQKEGVDYEETFSLVVKMVTVRCVLSLAVQKDWAIFQL
ncbi:putative RNA-directed DNA polymerase [Tanacetum coccineum]